MKRPDAREEAERRKVAGMEIALSSSQGERRRVATPALWISGAIKSGSASFSNGLN